MQVNLQVDIFFADVMSDLARMTSNLHNCA